jgi:8-oxo-dGTP diphosphatase
MDTYLVRHAKAGSRSSYDGPDDALRPLSGKGRAQADALADHLVPLGVARLVSSPFTRCGQTLAPVAARLGLPVESIDALAEGAGFADALTIIETADAPLVLCSHGDVIGDLITALDRRGVPVHGDGIEKASVWVVSVHDGDVVEARYHPPPRP